MLVTAAAGGTGQFAVQLAKMAGCHVVATCSSAEKGKMLRRCGREEICDGVFVAPCHFYGNDSVLFC